MYQLISATPSPYARKVRIALAEKGIEFELITEVPWDSTTQTPRYNPLEKLPILLLEDSGSVYESSYILEYLELKHPTPPLVASDIDQRLAARKLEVISDGVCDAVVLTFFERRRPRDCQSSEWSARQRRKIEGGVRASYRRSTMGRRQFVRSRRHRRRHGSRLPDRSLCGVRLAVALSVSCRLQRPLGATPLFRHVAPGSADHQGCRGVEPKAESGRRPSAG